MRKIKMVIQQSDKGGAGKSTVSSAVVAGLTAGGASPLVLDVDDGNSGYIRQNGQGSALPVSWTTQAAALDGWLAANLGNNDTLVLDLGANLMASGAPVLDFLGEFVVRVVRVGGEVTVLAIASTNAPGTGRLVKSARDSYGDYANVTIIENNQDNSANFSKSLATLSMPTASFPNIAAGVQASRLLNATPLIKALRAPPPGYTLAMAIYAERIYKFMTQPAVAQLFSSSAVATMADLAAGAVLNRAKVISDARQGTDVAIAANHTLWAARTHLRDVTRKNVGDLNAIGAAAIRVQDAEIAYAAAIR